MTGSNQENLKNKNILIVEHSTSHSELFGTYSLLLKDNNISWAVNKSHTDLLHNILNAKPSYIINPKDKKSPLLCSLHVLRHKYDYVLLNTGSGKWATFFCLFSLINKSKYITVIHNGKKVNKSFYQKLIALKTKKILVLAKYIQLYLKANLPPKYSIDYFYPIYFQQKNIESVSKPEKKIICIPGSVENKRRDYDFFAHFILSLKKEDLDYIKNNYSFYLLGRIIPENFSWFKQLQKTLGNSFKFYTSRISEEEYYSILHNSFLIWPLITENIANFKYYTQTKISGSFNLSYAFEVPMLWDKNATLEEVEHFSITYTQSNLIEILKEISANRTRYNLIKERIQEHYDFKILNQKIKILNFLSS